MPHINLRLRKLSVGGGVMANSYLQKRLQEKEKVGIDFLVTPLEYATDNAAMVAGLGFYLYNSKGVHSNIRLGVESS